MENTQQQAQQGQQRGERRQQPHRQHPNQRANTPTNRRVSSNKYGENIKTQDRDNRRRNFSRPNRNFDENNGEVGNHQRRPQRRRFNDNTNGDNRQRNNENHRNCNRDNRNDNRNNRGRQNFSNRYNDNEVQFNNQPDSL